MNARNMAFGPGGRPWQRRLLLSLGLMGLLGATWMAGAAGQEGSLPTAPAATGAPAATAYNVIPLSDDPLAFNVDINARGQVAFTELFELPDPGTYRARFYDGRNVRSISPFGLTAFSFALNNPGQVTGVVADDAFRWSREHGLVDLSRPATPTSVGIDINDLGDVAGAASFAPQLDVQHAARWNARNAVQDLGTLGGPRSLALAINDAGTVAGWSDAPPGGRLPFRWTPEGRMQALGSFPSDTAQASDVNAAGYIVGQLPFRAGGADHAFVWTPGHGLIDLGAGAGQSSGATRINDRGMVIGYVNNLPAYFRGFAWTRASGIVEFGTGSENSQALDLNNAGQVVGTIEGRAFAWTRSGGSVDLNTRVRNIPQGLVLRQAAAINDAGQIVANTNTGLVLLTRQAVSDLRPLVGAIQVTGTPRPGGLLSFAAAFTDADARDSHTATWDWGDGNTQAGAVNERKGRGVVTGQHAFDEGEFTIRLTVTDASGKRTVVRYALIVPAAPDAMSGQGVFMSPPWAAGPAALRPTLATVAVMAPAGSDGVALGKALVRFATAGMRLRSTHIASLERQGTQLRYRGEGKLNGVPGYRFMLAAAPGSDGGLERAHVRIWRRDPRMGAAQVAYDSFPPGHDSAAAAGQQAIPAEGSDPGGAQ